MWVAACKLPGQVWTFSLRPGLPCVWSWMTVLCVQSISWHANFLTKCEPFLSDWGCPAYGPEWLFFACGPERLSLSRVVYCRNFLYRDQLQQPILTQQPPFKTRIKQMQCSCVHKISSGDPSKYGSRPPGWKSLH